MPKLDPHPRLIAKAAAINGHRTRYSITGVQGLQLDCLPDGTRSWYCRYQVGSGRTRKERHLRLGSFSDRDPDYLSFGQAKDRAHEALVASKRDGQDPFAERRQTAGEVFGSLFRDWIERHSKVHKKTWRADEQLYALHVERRLGQAIATDVSRQDVIALLDRVADTAGPVQCNRVQALISACFSWAVDEGRLASHPAIRIRKRGKETARDRVLNDVELAAFWKAVDDQPPVIARALRLLTILGQRRSEIAEMTTSELTFDGDLAKWTIPSQRTKNGLKHEIPLPPTAVKIMKEAVADARGPYPFPARLVEPTPLHRTTLSHAFAEVAQSLSLEDVRLHDLRHVAATGMAASGVPLEIRQWVMNQVTGRRQAIGGRYDQHGYLEEKRRALELWERRLLAIVEGRPVPPDRY